MRSYGVVLCPNASAAIRAEKALARAGLSVKLIPTPPQLADGCDVVVRFDWSELDHVHVLLDAAHCDVVGVHLVKK